MNLPVITPEQIACLIFIFLRVSSMIVVMPIFGGDKTIPVGTKGGLSLLITFLLFPFVRMDFGFQLMGLTPMVVIMIGEILIGVIIGFVARFIFAGIQFAGELIGFQMGFSVVNIIDPVTSTQVSLISQLKYFLAMLVFLAVNAHHIFLSAMAESFVRISPMQFHLTERVIAPLCLLSMEVFIIAVKISAPVVAVLIFTHVALVLWQGRFPNQYLYCRIPSTDCLGINFSGIERTDFCQLLHPTFQRLGKTDPYACSADVK
jgi:flagellar biosynthetic protein FliR